jgi:hypothetical protein
MLVSENLMVRNGMPFGCQIRRPNFDFRMETPPMSIRVNKFDETTKKIGN